LFDKCIFLKIFVYFAKSGVLIAIFGFRFSEMWFSGWFPKSCCGLFYCSTLLQTLVVVSIKFVHQQMHPLLNLKNFKIYIKNHFDLLLHVSVYDHHQGAFIRA